MQRGLRILVLDDEDSVRQSLAAYLEDLDFQVSLASNAEEGIRRVAEGSFDIAIVDIRLPGKDGNAFIREAYELCPALQFLIHTGSKQYTLPEDLRNLGISEAQILLKPVSCMAVFAEAMKRLLSKGDV